MEVLDRSQCMQRSATQDYKDDFSCSPMSSPPSIRRSISMDTGNAGDVMKTALTSSGSFKRRSIRRRSSKRKDRGEPTFGHDNEAYDVIRERVLEERAVINAIDALQERWRMLQYMYDDCVELNEGRKERKLKRLSIKRQFELIIIMAIFFITCVPLFVILMLVFIR